MSCTDPLVESEGGFEGTTQCSDGLDNDADGLVDSEDPQCLGASSLSEASMCVDGADNDGDGWFDSEDPDCADVFAEVGVNPSGLHATMVKMMMRMAILTHWMVDVPVPLTMMKRMAVTTPLTTIWMGGLMPMILTVPVSEMSKVSVRNYAIPNDGDGYIDGMDSVCSNARATTELDDCEDGVDQDADGWIDYADPDCQLTDDEVVDTTVPTNVTMAKTMKPNPTV